MANGDFRKFMKKNKKEKSNEKVVVTKSITDEKGRPVEWELKPLTSKEVNLARKRCTYDVKDRRGAVIESKVDTEKLTVEMLTMAIVVPDLRDSELQDSYGVKTPQELLYAMVDDPGEYAALENRIVRMAGLDESMDDKIETAKN